MEFGNELGKNFFDNAMNKIKSNGSFVFWMELSRW
jgi:hypothetical protein